VNIFSSQMSLPDLQAEYTALSPVRPASPLWVDFGDGTTRQRVVVSLPAATATSPPWLHAAEAKVLHR
jgi:hypothetical protein